MISVDLILQSIINGVLIGCIYALVAIGIALQFGVMKIINFAHGDFVMLAMYATFWIAIICGIEGALTSIVTIPLFFILGVLIYKVIMDRVMDAPADAQVGVTIGLYICLRNLALAFWKADPRALPYTALSGTMSFGLFVVPLSRFISAVVSIVALITLHLFLTKTYLGITLRATGDDMSAASLMSVNIKKVFAFSFGLGAATTALAAAFLMTFQQVNPLSGLLYGLLSWCVIAMGGLGGVSGVLFSGLIIGIAEAVGTVLWEPRAREIIIYGLFILILWFKPRGIFGKR